MRSTRRNMVRVGNLLLKPIDRSKPLIIRWVTLADFEQLDMALRKYRAYVDGGSRGSRGREPSAAHRLTIYQLRGVPDGPQQLVDPKVQSLRLRGLERAWIENLRDAQWPPEGPS